MTRRKINPFYPSNIFCINTTLSTRQEAKQEEEKKILSPKPTKIKGTPMSLNRAALWVLLGDRTGKNLLEKLGLCEANTHRGLTYTRQTLLQNPTHFWMRNPASRGHEIAPRSPRGGNMSAVWAQASFTPDRAPYRAPGSPRGGSKMCPKWKLSWQKSRRATEAGVKWHWVRRVERIYQRSHQPLSITY